MWVSIISIAINYLAASLIIKHTRLGHAGLALSTSVVALFSFVCLFWILRNKIGGVYGRDLFSSCYKIGIASLMMGIVVSLLSFVLERWLGAGRLPSLICLGIAIPAGLGVLYATCKLLNVPELELAAKAFAGPLARMSLRATSRPVSSRERSS